VQFIATAEHTSGQSVGHPCRTGVYADPTDGWQAAITAATYDEALDDAQAALQDRVADYEPCTCQQHREPGSWAWWGSVALHLWPQDAAAMVAYRTEHGDEPIHDPYSLITADLKG